MDKEIQTPAGKSTWKADFSPQKLPPKGTTPTYFGRSPAHTCGEFHASVQSWLEMGATTQHLCSSHSTLVTFQGHHPQAGEGFLLNLP